MEPSALIKIIVFLAAFFAFVAVMIVLISVGLWRLGKRKKLESSAYASIAAQTGWSFSPAAPPQLKPYFDLIDKQIFPNTALLSTPAKNVLAASSQAGSFASFDYDHHAGMGTSVGVGGTTNWIYRKGVLHTANDLGHLPSFLIERRTGLGQALQNVVGTGTASPLLANFAVHGDQRCVDFFSAPEVFSALQSHGVARIAAGPNFLCVHFPRSENEIPEAESIRRQFAFVQNLAERLKR